VKKDRKIALVVNQVKMEDEDSLDILFWLNKTASERLEEVSRLRKSYYLWSTGIFPERIEKVIHRRKI